MTQRKARVTRASAASAAICIVLAACGAAPTAPQRVGTVVAAVPTATPQALTDSGATAPPELTITLGDTITLRLGETVSLGVDGASVSFDRVVEDSRCPADAQCIWQGRVVVAGTLTLGGQATPFTLGTLEGFADAPASLAAGPFVLSIAAVEPYPATPDGIPEDAYVLTLALTPAPR